MNTIRQFLAKPFPQEESIVESIRIAAVISLFVVFFLFVFKPFGIHQLESGQFLLCLGFGLVTFLASLVYELFVVFIVKLKAADSRFTFGKWILYFVGVMLVISFANFVFVRLVLFDDIQWALFPVMIRSVFAIGFFPTVVLGALALQRQERKYQAIADNFNQDSASAALTAQADSAAIFGIAADRIRYIEAMQNYIRLHYLDSNGEAAVKTERSTLKNVSDRIDEIAASDTIIQCHRSFLVNRQAIRSTSGNAQGLLLELADCERQIPVSRSFIPAFRAQVG